jgi:hypothetical protein
MAKFMQEHGADAMKLGPRAKGRLPKKKKNVAATSDKSGGGGNGDNHSNASNAAVNDSKMLKKRENVAVETNYDNDKDANEDEEDEMPEAWAD